MQSHDLFTTLTLNVLPVGFAKGHAKLPNSGRVKGQKNGATLEKEANLDALRAMIVRELGPMTAAQIQHAKGVSYMVLRRPDGTYARATDERMIVAALAAGSQAFQIFTQSPSTQAYADLLNRVFGKPAERVEVSGPDNGPLVITIKKPWADQEEVIDVTPGKALNPAKLDE